MKPMIIVAPGVISPEYIKKLEQNEICVVVAKDPAKVKFVDPIPAASQRGKIEDAAIKLSRLLLNKAWQPNDRTLDHSDIARFYMSFLIEGTSLSLQGTEQEQEKKFFDRAKLDELGRLAKEEARAECKALKEKSKLDQEGEP